MRPSPARLALPLAVLVMVTATPLCAVPVRYDGFERSSRYITSGDGTRLAIDIYRPTHAGRPAPELLPVLFTQDRTERRTRGLRTDMQAYAARGYVVVAQDRRGTGASFGVQKGFVTRDDSADGKAVVEWAGDQSWSTGRVGAMGCSNQGVHQYALAAERPRHLVAIAPECASPFFWDTMISPGGVSSFALGDQPPYAGECGATPEPGPPVDADRDGALARAAAAEHRCNARFLAQYRANMHRDTLNAHLGYTPATVDTAATRSAAIRASGVKIFAIGGWFDASPGAQLQGWQLWGGHALIGPWTHCSIWDADGYPNDRVMKQDLQLRFFDAVLKGEDNGFAREVPIRYYTMNAPVGTEWRLAMRWPLPRQRLTSYYLGAGRSGTVASLHHGMLSASAPRSEAAADHYRADPAAALFDGGYSALRRWFDGDMRPGFDSKAATYTMAPLAADLQVTGHPEARLWLSASVPDIDVFAVLEDVAPDGRSTYVTHGTIRASRRALGTPPWGDLGTPWHPQRSSDDQPLVAGRPVALRFDFLPTSWVFRTGHRVRISIAHSGGKMFQQSSGAGGGAPEVTVWRDARHASRLILPVIPADAIKGKPHA